MVKLTCILVCSVYSCYFPMLCTMWSTPLTPKQLHRLPFQHAIAILRVYFQEALLPFRCLACIAIQRQHTYAHMSLVLSSVACRLCLARQGRTRKERDTDGRTEAPTSRCLKESGYIFHQTDVIGNCLLAGIQFIIEHQTKLSAAYSY